MPVTSKHQTEPVDDPLSRLFVPTPQRVDLFLELFHVLQNVACVAILFDYALPSTWLLLIESAIRLLNGPTWIFHSG